MARLHQAAATGNLEKVIEYILAMDDVDNMSDVVTSKGDLYAEHKGSGEFGRYMTPLHLAAYNGHTKIAEKLILSGANIHSRDKWRECEGNTALEIAISRKNLGLATMLIKYGAKDEKNLLSKNLSKRDIDDELFQAVLYKKPEVIQDIYDCGLLSQKQGEKALIYAAEFNSLSVMETLLACGFSPDAFDGKKTALGAAAEYGHDAIAELLLKNGAQVDKYTSVGRFQSDCTPLRKALIHIGDNKTSNPRLIELLLSSGADIKKINPGGLTFLAKYGMPDELELLLKCGLNPDTATEEESLLDICFDNRKFELAIKLINFGAQINRIDKKGKTYLHKSNHLGLTQLLLEKGLDIEWKDKEGKTPIEYADVEVAEFLADKGASINKMKTYHHVVLSSNKLLKQLIKEGLATFNTPNEQGRTALHLLARRAGLDGYLENLTYVLKNKNDLNDLNIHQADDGGWTALHFAFSENRGFVNYLEKEIEDEHVAQSKYTKAIDLLIGHGATPLKDKLGRTPLMCLTKNEFSLTYNSSVIDRYYKFEANYFGVNPEWYKNKLFKLRRGGFCTVSTDFALFKAVVPIRKAVDLFWEEAELSKTVNSSTNLLNF